MNIQHGDNGASWKERTKIHRQKKMSAEPYKHTMYVRWQGVDQDIGRETMQTNKTLKVFSLFTEEFSLDVLQMVSVNKFSLV